MELCISGAWVLRGLLIMQGQNNDITATLAHCASGEECARTALVWVEKVKASSYKSYLWMCLLPDNTAAYPTESLERIPLENP